MISITNDRYVASTLWGFTLLDSAFNFISYGTVYGVEGGWYPANDGGFYGVRGVGNYMLPSLQHDAVGLLKTDSLGFIYNVQGIAQLQQSGGLSVYPNPVLNELVISNGQLANGKPVAVTVYDVMGKQKLQQNLTATDGKLKLDVSSLQSGIYFLRVEEKGKVYNAKFVKE